MIIIIYVPAKLDRCVADVKKQGGVDNPWAVCNASIGKEAVKEKDYPWSQCMADQKKEYGNEDSAKKVCGSIKAKYGETIIQEKVNKNRQDPYPSPKIKTGKIEPDIQKTPKGIGGLRGKIDERKRQQESLLYKQILDTKLRQLNGRPKKR